MRSFLRCSLPVAVALALASGGRAHAGFIFTKIAPPGALSTSAYRINDNGGNPQIVGTFTDSLGTHGFVDIGGTYTPLNAPGASSTSAFGINSNG